LKFGLAPTLLTCDNFPHAAGLLLPEERGGFLLLDRKAALKKALCFFTSPFFIYIILYEKYTIQKKQGEDTFY